MRLCLFCKYALLARASIAGGYGPSPGQSLFTYHLLSFRYFVYTEGMAAIAEDVRHLQAGNEAVKDTLHPVISPCRLRFPARFAESLRPDLPRPSAAALGTRLDLSDERGANEQIFTFSDHQAFSRATEARRRQRGAVIFPADVQTLSDAYFVETGQNDYWDPGDRQIHEGAYIEGTRDDLGRLALDREALVRSGKYPVRARHRHPDEEIPVHSIDDLLVLLMQQRDGVAVPLLNAQTVLGKSKGEKLQTTAVRVKESLPIRPSHRVRVLGEKWKGYLRGAGRAAQQEWERRYGVLRPDASVAEAAAFDTYIDAAEDSVLAAFGDFLQVQFFFSRDLREGHLLPPGEIIRILRTEQEDALHKIA